MKGAVVTCNSKESGALEKDPVPQNVNEAKRQKWFVPWPGDRREGQLERKSKDPGLGYKKSQLAQGARQVGSQKPESHVRQATPSE